ncbi:MAG: hypothetical protein JWQ27_1674 [Ferruginibacter sp.]|nr:hypothetical protein [Ferruginibacter sp.]
MTNNKQIFRKIWRVFLYLLLGVFTILLLAFAFIYTNAGKRVVRNRVQSYLENKLHTKVSIGAVDYSLPQWLEIKRVYIEDQQHDTLIYGEELSADLNMIKLLSGNTDIQKLYFKNILINVHRPETDTTFNYEFIVNAFAGNKSTTAIPDTAALKLTLDRLIFDNVALRFKDEYGGSNFIARIKGLDATLNKFQPDRSNFGINDFAANEIDFFMNTYKESVLDSIIAVTPDTIAAKKTYGLYITAGHFNVKKVNVTVDNKVSGLYYANRVTKLGLSNVLFNLDQSIAIADSLVLDSSFVQFKQPKKRNEISAIDTTVAPPWLIQVKQLNIGSSQLQYDDANKPAAGGLDFAHFNASNLNVNIHNFIYSADSTAAQVSQFSFADASGFQLDSTHLNFLFTDTILSAKELYVKTPHTLLQDAIEIRYDSLSAMTLHPQNSLVSANFSKSVIAFNDLYLLMPSLKKTFAPASFANNTISFNTELRGNLQRLYLPYLQLSGLSGSSITGRGTLYNLTDPNRLAYDLYIDKSIITKKDLLKFVPAANQEALAKLPAIFNLSGHFTGDKNNLVADVNTSAKDISFNGRIALNNISNPAALKYDLAVKNAIFDRNFILGFVPAGSLPPQIELPQKISASGKFKGSVNDFVADLKLNGSYGPATVKGFMRNMKNPEAAVYDLYITTPGFNIGRLLKQDTVLGMVSGNFKAKGTGFNYKTMRSAITADIAALQFNKYNYHNARLDADFNRGLISSEGQIKDSSLRLIYNLTANVRDQYPTIDAMIDVDTAQLQKLHLYNDTLNFSTKANIKSNSTRPRSLDINALLDNTKLQLSSGKYVLDTVSLVATSLNGVDDINFRAPFAQVHANGAFDYDKVGPSILQYINNYYSLTKTKHVANIPDQQMTIDGLIKYSPIVTGIIPGLECYDDISFRGNYRSADTDSALSFIANLPHLKYTSYDIANGKVNIASRNERINYDLGFDTLHYLKNTFYGTTINGAAANDSLVIRALTQDNKRTNWFGIKASLGINDDTYSFRIEDSLLLNYERWKVAPDNLISYSPKGLLINNFSISSDTAKISINSKQPVPNSPIDVLVDNFNLKSISSIISTDTLFAAGIMDAQIEVSELEKALPAFVGNAQVLGFELMQHPIGDIKAFATRESDNTVAANLTLTGNNNDIVATGKYFLNNPEKEFDGDLDIKQLNFATLEAFTAGAIKNSSGNIHGQVNLSGKFSEPHWNGQLNFDTTKFTLAQLGTPYLINNQKIILNYPRIEIPKLVVNDSLGHVMNVDGVITANSLYKYDLNVDVNATDFIIMNAPKAIANELYGYASVDANISITGNSERPRIEGDVYVNDESDVTIVLPETSYNKDDAKTVVRFIDRDTFAINPPQTKFEPAVEPAVGFAQFLNYNLNIEINKNSVLTIIVDPVTGDEIQVQGDAQLNAGVDPGGNIILAGTYELDKGYYVLNYQFLQRKFNLVKGSTITFGGTPMSARIAITAEYIANTSARDLINNEVTDVSPTLSNSFNQKLPFKVVLYLTGVLSRPDINFDIQLPEESNLLTSELRTTIENKLQQLRGDQAATNKQVFSLLLLNRFVGEQSSDFFKGNGSDFSDLARQSVSQFLSSALNEIASDLFKGIDIDLNLNSYNDFSNGGNEQRTDLNVAVSKRFLDDRLTVSVGKNFGIEGGDPAVKANGSNSGFRPDVTVSYKLTKDGKYMIRAYTKNQFEVVLDGYVVENGVAFLVTMDYEKFRELFRRKK